MAGDLPQNKNRGERDLPGEGGGTVGHYRLIRQIGHGGMGIVYEAADERSGERVAVKFMSRDRIRDDFAHRKRFKREMIVAAMLNHPGTTRLIDFGEHEGGAVLRHGILGGMASKLSGARSSPGFDRSETNESWRRH